MEFKDRLKQLRKSKYLSQEALANQLYVSRSLVARWEAGLCLPTEESLEKIAEFFEVDKETLIRDNVSSLELVKKNITIRKMSNKLWLSIAAIILLSVILVVTLVVFEITAKNRFYNMVPTITKVEFIPIDTYDKVDDLDYNLDYSNMPVYLSSYNETMTRLIDKSLDEFDLQVNSDGSFVSGCSRQKVKIYFENPYNQEFAYVGISGESTGYHLYDDEIVIIDNYIYIDDFYIYDGDLLNLNLSVRFYDGEKQVHSNGIITSAQRECKYLFNNNFEIYVGDIYANAQVSEVEVIDNNATFSIFSQVEKGSYGKLLIYNSFYEKTAEYLFDNSGDFVKEYTYAYKMEEVGNYYYVLLIVGNGYDLRKPQVIVSDYGVFNGFDQYENGYSQLGLKADFATDSSIYLRIDNLTENIAVNEVVVYKERELVAEIKDFVVINNETFAVFENYDKNVKYDYYLVFNVYNEYREYVTNIYKANRETSGLYDEKIEINSIEILNPQETYRVGDIIYLKINFKNLPDKLFSSFEPLNYFVKYGIEDNFDGNTLTLTFRLYETGTTLLGLKYLYYHPYEGTNFVNIMHFAEFKFVEINVVA